MKKRYDLVFIGSGLSCAYTLVHYINVLQKQSSRSPKNLLLIDKDEEFWTGVAYGNRSGYNSLIITPLKDFIPQSDWDSFILWLKKNIDWLFDDFKKRGGILSSWWLSENEMAIKDHLWGDIYIPRYIFGLFIKEKVTSLLDQAVNDGLIKYQLLTGVVVNIQKESDLYKILTEISLKGSVTALSKKVILSIGSPPVRPMNGLINKKLPTSSYVIEDFYQPGVNENIEKIGNFLRGSVDRYPHNVLIIGSNASALEALYNLMDSEELSKLIDKFYILSSSGRFPHLIKGSKNLSDFYPQNLNLLKRYRSVASKKIFEAVKNDLEIAQKEKIDHEDAYYSMVPIINELVNKLNFNQQEKFVNKYGIEIGKYNRRAGKDYLEVVEKLIKEGKIEFLKGKFIKQLVINGAEAGFQYKEVSTRAKKDKITPLSIVINCTGSHDLKQSSSSSGLINNLIKQNICNVNNSSRGFGVNANFEANKNFYIMGPLLAGNIIGNNKVWHAESCIRIFSLTSQLANLLV